MDGTYQASHVRMELGLVLCLTKGFFFMRKHGPQENLETASPRA